MREKSSNTAKIKVFKLNYESILQKIREYAISLIEKRLAKSVILFGSLARGDYTPFSDIDLLIIIEKSSKKPIERIRDYINPSLPLDVEPRAYTEKEFIELAKKKRKLIREILNYGILLAGDKKILTQAKKYLINSSNI